jgi:hypothetical protein
MVPTTKEDAPADRADDRWQPVLYAATLRTEDGRDRQLAVRADDAEEAARSAFFQWLRDPQMDVADAIDVRAYSREGKVEEKILFAVGREFLEQERQCWSGRIAPGVMNDAVIQNLSPAEPAWPTEVREVPEVPGSTDGHTALASATSAGLPPDPKTAENISRIRKKNLPSEKIPYVSEFWVDTVRDEAQQLHDIVQALDPSINAEQPAVSNDVEVEDRDTQSTLAADPDGIEEWRRTREAANGGPLDPERSPIHRKKLTPIERLDGHAFVIPGIAAGMSEDLEAATEFTKRKVLIPGTKIWNDILFQLKRAQSLSVPSGANVLAAIASIERLGLRFTFDIWMKDPERGSAESVMRALRAHDIDHEDFLAELQRLLRLPEGALHRGALAQLILPLKSMLDANAAPWWMKDKYRHDIFKSLAGATRKYIRANIITKENQKVGGNGGPRMPKTAGRSDLGIPPSLKEQADAWLERTVRSRWVYPEDFGMNMDLEQRDPWDLFSPDIAGLRACRRNGRDLGACYDPSPEPLPEIASELMERYLPERDAETFRKIGECGRGEITDEISHADYVSLCRQVEKLPSKWNIADLREFLAGQQEPRQRQIESPQQPPAAEGRTAAICLEFENYPDSWYWPWDKTRLVNFHQGKTDLLSRGYTSRRDEERRKFLDRTSLDRFDED